MSDTATIRRLETSVEPAFRVNFDDEDHHARKRLESRIYWDVVSERPKSIIQFLSKIVSEPHFLMSVVRKNLHFGKPKAYAILTTDRIVLEQQIFRYYAADPDIKNILFVGCDADTAGYHAHFADRRYVTLEPIAENRSFGASQHIVGIMEHMGDHIPPASLDLILCNGVFGWGLDAKENCEKAFAAAYNALKPGGQLLLGWNDVPRRCPVPLESIASLSRFRRYDIPLFGTFRYRTDTVYRHVFDFYVK